MLNTCISMYICTQLFSQGQNESVVKVTLRFLGTSTTLNCRQAVGRRRKQKIQVKKGAASKSELNLALTGVVVQQQARGYTPVTVYKGQIRPGGTRIIILYLYMHIVITVYIPVFYTIFRHRFFLLSIHPLHWHAVCSSALHWWYE